MSISYITDSDISMEIFGGDDVPGPNTISQAENEHGKQLITDCIHVFCSKVKDNTKFTDTYGALRRVALRLYKKWLEDNPVDLEESDKQELRRFKYATAPVKSQIIARNIEKVDT